MRKVKVRPLRRKGGPIMVHEKVARLLVDRGTYAYANDDRSTYAVATDRAGSTEESASGSDYADMRYRDLQKMVKERGVEADGRKAEDLISALEKADGQGSARYNRRDMQAED